MSAKPLSREERIAQMAREVSGWPNDGCRCDPPYSGEEWCVGTCAEKARADAAEAERDQALRRKRGAQRRRSRAEFRYGTADDARRAAEATIARVRNALAALDGHTCHEGHTDAERLPLWRDCVAEVRAALEGAS